MSQAIDIGYLERMIANQRTALRIRIIWVALMAAGGVFVFLNSPATSEAIKPTNLDTLLRIGGIFFSGLSLFPLKDVFEKRGFISALEYLRRTAREIQALGEAVEDSTVDQFKQRFEVLLNRQLGLKE